MSSLTYTTIGPVAKRVSQPINVPKKKPKRGGRFNPTKVDDLVLWLDAANRGTTSLQWDDRSGNGNHYTSPAAANFPSFSGGAAIFDGTNDYLDGPGYTSLTQAEMFILHKRYSNTNETGNNTGWNVFGWEQATEHFAYGGVIYCSFFTGTRKTCGDPALNLANYHRVNIQSKAGSFVLRLNNTTQYSTASNTVNASRATSRLGASGLATYKFQGSIKAVLLYGRVLSADERAGVEAYLDSL